MSSSKHSFKSTRLFILHRRGVALGASLSCFAAFSAMSGSGCLARTVTSPGNGGTGAGSSTVSGPSGVTSTTTGMTVAPTALALMATELPPDAMPCGFMAMPCTPPPDTLFLEIASLGNTCQTPLGPLNSGGTFWQRQLGLPAADQAVGTYPIMGSGIYWEGEQAMSSPQGASGVTSGGPPGAGFGTLQIISIDKMQVTFSLTGLDQEDGQYVAKRCTPLP
jgi:hypothetical protein